MDGPRAPRNVSARKKVPAYTANFPADSSVRIAA